MLVSNVALPSNRYQQTSEDDLSLGEDVAILGWCAGAVVPQDMLPVIAQHLVRPGEEIAIKLAETDWFVIVSQTCDVVARTREAEPFVEVLHCKQIDKLRVQYKDFRSTRIIDFRPHLKDHETTVLTAHAVADRYLIPRELLKNCAPDGKRFLSKDATRRIMGWYALRASRPSWPDAFVARIKKETLQALENALLPLKDDIAEVRIIIKEKEQELDSSQLYNLVVYFVVDAEIWDSNIEGRKAIQSSYFTFVSVLKSCGGFEVNEDISGAVSGNDFTWQETRASEEWNFANLSHREQ